MFSIFIVIQIKLQQFPAVLHYHDYLSPELFIHHAVQTGASRILTAT